MIQTLIFLTNAVLINCAILLSFFIRYGTDIPKANFQPYKENFAVLTLIYILSLTFARVFKNRFRSLWDLFQRVFVGLFLGTLLSVALIYVFRVQWSKLSSSIFVIFFQVGLSLVFLLDGLILLVAGRIRKNIVIFEHSKLYTVLITKKFVEITKIDTIEDLVEHQDVDEVIICTRFHNDKDFNLLVFLLQRLNINVLFAPSIYNKILTDNFSENQSIRFVATLSGSKSEHEEFLIRTLDIVGSITMLLFLHPLILLVCLLIKLSSRGPIFYKQERVGKDGEIFVMYKFRTMKEDAESQSGPVLATRNDPRVTGIGQFLRETRLDELPQLLNVLCGNMSLVGPRPERPYFVQRHKVLRGIRLAVKPGLTGLAQVRNLYSLHPKHKIKYDFVYIQKRSFLLNLYLLVKTIPVIFSRNGQ